jgi:hypothetical protein
MPPALRTVARLAGHLAFAVVIAAGAAWAATALWVQLAPPVLWLAWAALALAVIAALALRWRSRARSWAVVLIAAVAVGGWYMTLHPRQDRDWAPDVAHGVTSTVAGDIVTVSNIRNFDWTSTTEATERWETRTYDLAQLDTVDMFTSVWDNPDIAHLLVSFGFSDGQYLTFSVEIRREADEVFSSIGGFFRQFEIALIAADEGDIIRLRTNFRREDVHRFAVNLNAEQRRALFLTYLDFGNQLAAEPKFYNTVTANCASTVYQLVRAIKPDMPLDRRLLFSGGLPEYIDELGGLVGDMPMDQRRKAGAITARAQAIPAGADFSAGIRAEN